MKVLVINGPNLNNLGSRDKSFYGSESYQDVIQNIEEYAEILQVEVTFFQGNSEGELISFIQKEVDEFEKWVDAEAQKDAYLEGTDIHDSSDSPFLAHPGDIPGEKSE